MSVLAKYRKLSRFESLPRMAHRVTYLDHLDHLNQHLDHWHHLDKHSRSNLLLPAYTYQLCSQLHNCIMQHYSDHCIQLMLIQVVQVNSDPRK